MASHVPHFKCVLIVNLFICSHRAIYCYDFRVWCYLSWSLYPGCYYLVGNKKTITRRVFSNCIIAKFMHTKRVYYQMCNTAKNGTHESDQ